ncbi:hypothetical protein SUNI508_12188 [Seiridium unicorne]|uniref:CFEM domain-containing protein n=1 Tax=Seiridium unicorne TaxID=138068 RepID=A0ABR2UET8_9PEZI
MRVLTFVSLVLVAFQAGVLANTSTTTPPTCGLLCIEQEALSSTCSLTNTTCICTNVPLNDAISACVQANCTIREQIAVERYSKYTCGAPSRDRTTLVWVIGLVFGILGLVGFGLRVASRVLVGGLTWGPDDWAMTLAVACMIPLTVLSLPRRFIAPKIACRSPVDNALVSQAGLGRDIWNVDPDDITRVLYLYFYDELVYLAALPLTKISILLCYLKIFPKREMKIAIWIFIALNIGYLISFEVVSIFQCTPIQGAWRGWDGEFPTTCRNINVQGWMSAFINVILDFGTIILPLPELYNLSMSRKKKVQIMLMFSVGFFVSIVSIVRFKSLAAYASTANVTPEPSLRQPSSNATRIFIILAQIGEVSPWNNSQGTHHLWYETCDVKEYKIAMTGTPNLASKEMNVSLDHVEFLLAEKKLHAICNLRLVTLASPADAVVDIDINLYLADNVLQQVLCRGTLVDPRARLYEFATFFHPKTPSTNGLKTEEVI